MTARERLLELAESYFQQARRVLDSTSESDSRDGELRNAYRAMVELAGEEPPALSPPFKEQLEFWLGLAAVAVDDSAKIRLRAFEAMLVGHNLRLLLQGDSRGVESERVVMSLKGLAGLANAQTWDVFERGERLLPRALATSRAEQLSYAMSADRFSDAQRAELSRWLDKARIINDESVESEDRARQASHAFAQVSQILAQIEYR